jgi:DNA-binding transcriptional LysR family regulator
MNGPNVTLRQLRAFIAVAQTSGFAPAARLLHLTPSALSLLVRDLEAATGVRLFDRTTRRTALSLAGAEFYPLAKKVLEDLNHAVRSTRDLEQKKRGSVRIACTPLYSSTLLPELTMQFRKRFPAVAIYILDSLNQQALSRVASGEADLGIAPQRITPPEVVQESFLKDRIWMICRPEHPLASARSVSWAKVLREPFVSLTQDFTVTLQADLFRYSPSLVLNPAHNVSLLTTALGMVQWGHGITAQPAHALPLAKPFGLVCRPLTRPIVHRHLSLFFRRSYELSPAAASFRAFLYDFVQSKGGATDCGLADGTDADRADADRADVDRMDAGHAAAHDADAGRSGRPAALPRGTS